MTQHLHDLLEVYSRARISLAEFWTARLGRAL